MLSHDQTAMLGTGYEGHCLSMIIDYDTRAPVCTLFAVRGVEYETMIILDYPIEDFVLSQTTRLPHQSAFFNSITSQLIPINSMAFELTGSYTLISTVLLQTEKKLWTD